MVVLSSSVSGHDPGIGLCEEGRKETEAEGEEGFAFYFETADYFPLVLL